MKSLSLITLIALISTSAMAKDHSYLLKNARKHSLARFEREKKQIERKIKYLSQKTEKDRRLYLAHLEKQKPGLYKNLQSQASKIRRSKLSSEQKQKEYRRLFKKYEGELKKAYKKSSPDERSYSSLFSKLFGNGLLGEFLSWLYESERRDAPQISDDLLFLAPYSEEQIYDSNALIAAGNSNADKEEGSTSANAIVILSGVSSSQVGMQEVFHVPQGVERVRVSATVDIDTSSFVMAIAGVAWTSTGTYIEAFGENQIVCHEDVQESFTIAPLLWFMLADSSDTHTMTCEFEPSNLGGDYVITAGTKAFGSAILPGDAIARASGRVEQMKVEFIQD